MCKHCVSDPHTVWYALCIVWSSFMKHLEAWQAQFSHFYDGAELLVVVVIICICQDFKDHASHSPVRKRLFMLSPTCFSVGVKSVELNSQIKPSCHINSVTWKASINHAWHFNLTSLVTSAGDISDEMEERRHAPCG